MRNSTTDEEIIEDEDDENIGKTDEGTWLTSYADLMTLIACFFILMVAFANFEDPTFQRKAKEFGRYFRGSLIQDDGQIEETAIAESKIEDPINQVPHENVDNPNKKKDHLAPMNNLSKTAGPSQISPPKNIEIIFSASAIFNPGRVTLTKEVKESIEVMIDLIKNRKGNFIILVEGHTDDTDIRNIKYPSNWELSAARAAKVLSQFESSGIKRNKLVAVGYGDTRPLYINKDKTGRPIPVNQRLNRRVEIKVILQKDSDSSEVNPGIFFRGKNIPSKAK